MTPPLTAEEVFRSLDKDGNGKIDREEYAQALVKMHIPQAISDVVTESVFSKFDSNNDACIDKKEFMRYFANDSNIALHKRMFRAQFDEKFTLFFGLYFCLVGCLLMNCRTMFGDLFDAKVEENGPACHMTFILGFTWFTNGVNALMQGHFGVSRVFGYGSVAVMFAILTIYENVIGSIVGEPTFKAPPIQATVLSVALGIYGLWSIKTERAKVKDD